MLTSFILLAGCLSHPRLETVLYDRGGAVVSLKEFADASIRASHPAAVDPRLLATVLAGLRVRAQNTLIESVLGGEAQPIPAFTTSEVNLLAPLVADALNRATAFEHVRFQLEVSESGTPVTCEGGLYMTEGDVNLFLTQYGRTPQRPPTLSRPSQSFDRPKRWALTFVPEEARVGRGVQPIVPSDAAEPGALVISLRRLEHAPGPGGDADAAPGETERVPDAREQTHHVDAMEEELRRLRRSLQEQEERLEQLERQLDAR